MGAFETLAPLRRANQVGGSAIPLNPLFQDIEQLLKSLSKPILEGIKKFVGVNTSLFRTLAQELSFYTGASSFFQDLKKKGFVFCMPELAPLEDRILCMHDFYNLHLK